MVKVETKITHRNLIMEYSKARKLSANRFKRLTGVQKPTFKRMVELVKNEEKKKKKTGCPCKLQQISFNPATSMVRLKKLEEVNEIWQHIR